MGEEERRGEGREERGEGRGKGKLKLKELGYGELIMFWKVCRMCH